MEQLVGKYRRVERGREDDAERELQDARELAYYQDDDGMWIIHARLPPETGSLVVKAIAAVTEPLREAQRAARLAPPAEAFEEPEAVSAETSAMALEQIAPDVDAHTLVPHWDGVHCDYGMAVDGLLRRKT